MNTSLLSRARTAGIFAATALVTTLAVAGPARAGGADRITVTSTAICSANGTVQGVDLFYDDHVDGHVPLSVDELVLRGSSEGGIEEWSGGGLYQEDGNYFNRRSFAELGIEIDQGATYTYWVTISYDDGVTQTGSALIDLATACAAAPPTTSAPQPEPAPDRFGLWASGFWCGGQGSDAHLSWHYADYPDGHYAARVDIDVLKNGAPYRNLHVAQPDPSSDGAETDFALPSGVFGDVEPLEVASYSLTVTITYEDGATDTHIETFDLDQICDGRVNGQTASTMPATTAPSSPDATTPTVPGGTLPETGSSNLTWVIGAVGGLLTTAGAALVAGVRRPRTD
jgi:hypothetical protein